MLNLVAEDLSDSEISRKRGIAIKTVQKHIENTYKKLKVNTRAGAAIWLLTRRLEAALQENARLKEALAQEGEVRSSANAPFTTPDAAGFGVHAALFAESPDAFATKPALFGPTASPLPQKLPRLSQKLPRLPQNLPCRRKPVPVCRRSGTDLRRNRPQNLLVRRTLPFSRQTLPAFHRLPPGQDPNPLERPNRHDQSHHRLHRIHRCKPPPPLRKSSTKN